MASRGRGIAGEGETLRPLIMRASAICSPGAETPVNAVSLINQEGEPFELHEIRFALYPVGKPGAGQTALPVDRVLNYDTSGMDLAAALPNSNVNGAAVAGSMIGAQFRLGDNVMSNGFVPVWSYGAAKNLGEEILSDWWIHFFSGLNGTYQGHATEKSLSAFYSWKLDHPLWIPPGKAVEPTFFHFGLTAVPMMVVVLYLGRVAPQRPEPGVVRLPYVAHWRSKAWNAEDRPSIDVSPETALRNPFDTDLRVERFTGRISQTWLPSGQGFTTGLPIGVPFMLDDAQAGYWSERLRITMTGSDGSHVIREPVPFRNAFGGVRRVWPCQHDIPPGAFYRVKALLASDPVEASLGAGQYGGPTSLTGIQNTRAAADIAMIGWRKVHLDV